MEPKTDISINGLMDGISVVEKDNNPSKYLMEKRVRETNADPEFFICIGRRHATKRYSQMSLDCQRLADDLTNSSELEMFKHWDVNFKRKYYSKAIYTAYLLGKFNNKNIFTKIKEWINTKIKTWTIETNVC